MEEEIDIKLYLDDLYAHYESVSKKSLGYPCNQKFDYKEIAQFLKFHINNVGSTFGNEDPYPLNSHKEEREVLEYLLKLFNSPGLESHRGYITTGGTEGNLYGMYLGREHFNNNCVFIFSKSSHYSVTKNAKILNVSYECVDSDVFGEIDYTDLKQVIERTHKPLVIIANIGTTMTGAIDNVDKIIQMCENLRKEYYIHCDAALSGMMIPFIEKPINPELPSFEKNIYSIAISGHKFIGSPIPCGVVLADRKCMYKVSKDISYIHSDDYTITGSRSGITPLILWLALKRTNWNEFADMVRECRDLSWYAVGEINKILGYHKAYVANRYSNTVVFPSPSKRLVSKWHLATENGFAHIIIMPNVTKGQVDEFVEDLRQENT